MSDLIPVLRALIRDELRQLQLGEIGVVTAIFPHSPGDTHNYECSLRLRDGTLELRQVPMCTPHIGQASAPRVGDLVLVTYLHGDPNQPVVLGRLYSDEAPPPPHAEGAWHVSSPYTGQTSLTLAADGTVRLKSGETTVTMFQGGDIEIESAKDLKVNVKGAIRVQSGTSAAIEVSGDATVTAASVTVKADSIELGEGGAGVVTTMTHPACLFTGAPFKGSSIVKAKA